MKIVCAIDASDQGLAALRRAIQLAEPLRADLHVVHSAFIPAHMVYALGTVPTDFGDLEKQDHEAVWEAAGPELEGHDAKRVDLEGYPPDAIVAYAKESGADLIVVGSRGRGEFASLLLGSTSHAVLNAAPCDVLVVRSGTEPQ